MFASRFLDNSRGSILILFAFLLVPAAIAVGMAIDFSYNNSIRTKLQTAADAAALAVLKEKMTSDKDLDGVVVRLIESNMFDVDLDGFTYEAKAIWDDEDESTVTIEINYEIPAQVLSIIGKDVYVGKVSSTTKAGLATIEVAMVLDVSMSMSGNKISTLRETSVDFVNQLYGEGENKNLFVSVVPFGGAVSNGSEYKFIEKSASGNPWSGCIDITKESFDDSLLISDNYGLIDPGGSKSVCPPSQSDILSLSNNKDAIVNKLRSMQLSWGTATNLGVYWGGKNLSPSWRGLIGSSPNVPADYGAVPKFMIVMTDGGITGDWYKSLYHQGQAIEMFKQGCSAAKSNGIVVYTISFFAGGRMGSLLESCATDSSYFHEVGAKDLGEVFAEIYESISGLTSLYVSN